MNKNEKYARWYRKNREKKLAWKRSWEENNPEKVKAQKKRYYQKHKVEIRKKVKIWIKSHPEKASMYGRKAFLKLKKELLDSYGHLCLCCGITEDTFLSLDHIDSADGKRHKLKYSTYGIWLDLKRRGWPKVGYRILCHNCNMAIRWERICPHQISAPVSMPVPTP